MKTQTQTETEAEAETKTGVHQQPQHALVAGARTFIWPWPMAQWLNASSDTESKSESEWGKQGPHARIVARPRSRPHPRPWPLSSRHLSHASISDLRSALSALLCSAQFSLCSALPWSALCLSCLHVDSLRRCSDAEVAEFAQAEPRSRSIFMANWR